MSLRTQHKDAVLGGIFVCVVTFTAALSLIWILSYKRSVTLYRVTPQHKFEVRAHEGRLWLVQHEIPAGVTAAEIGLEYPRVEHATPWPAEPSTRHLRDSKFLGFVSVNHPLYTVEIIPFWSILTAAALYHVWWLRRSHACIRRTTSGTCMHCGYDLRTIVDRCPECGRAFGQPHVQALPARPRPAYRQAAAQRLSDSTLSRQGGP